MKSSRTNTSGFTLFEIMIVMAIIIILLGIWIFPYRLHMQRAYTERAADWISQEWILAHKAVRSGIEFDPVSRSHARILMVFEKWKSEIATYLVASGVTINDVTSLPIGPTSLQKYKSLILEDGVSITGFTGDIFTSTTTVGYMISPPSGSGIFFTGSLISGMPLKNVRLIVGYPGAFADAWRSREVLLRWYLQ